MEFTALLEKAHGFRFEYKCRMPSGKIVVDDAVICNRCIEDSDPCTMVTTEGESIEQNNLAFFGVGHYDELISYANHLPIRCPHVISEARAQPILGNISDSNSNGMFYIKEATLVSCNYAKENCAWTDMTTDRVLLTQMTSDGIGNLFVSRSFESMDIVLVLTSLAKIIIQQTKLPTNSCLSSWDRCFQGLPKEFTQFRALLLGAADRNDKNEGFINWNNLTTILKRCEEGMLFSPCEQVKNALERGISWTHRNDLLHYCNKNRTKTLKLAENRKTIYLDLDDKVPSHKMIISTLEVAKRMDLLSLLEADRPRWWADVLSQLENQPHEAFTIFAPDVPRKNVFNQTPDRTTREENKDMHGNAIYATPINVHDLRNAYHQLPTINEGTSTYQTIGSPDYIRGNSPTYYPHHTSFQQQRCKRPDKTSRTSNYKIQGNESRNLMEKRPNFEETVPDVTGNCARSHKTNCISCTSNSFTIQLLSEQLQNEASSRQKLCKYITKLQKTLDSEREGKLLHRSTKYYAKNTNHGYTPQLKIQPQNFHSNCQRKMKNRYKQSKDFRGFNQNWKPPNFQYL